MATANFEIGNKEFYELNAPDVVASIIFAPSVIAPVLLTAYDVWEPVSYTEPSK